MDNRLLPYSSLKKMMTRVVAHLNTGCYWLFEKSANIQIVEIENLLDLNLPIQVFIEILNN